MFSFNEFEMPPQGEPVSLLHSYGWEIGDKLKFISPQLGLVEELTLTDNNGYALWKTKNNTIRLDNYPDIGVQNTGYTPDHSITVDIVKVRETIQRSNALTVYQEGTVKLGHDPIGPMDAATKQYVDSHASSGGVDEEQVRAIVEDVLLNGAW
jgi:hypothetical protein